MVACKDGEEGRGYRGTYLWEGAGEPLLGKRAR